VDWDARTDAAVIGSAGGGLCDDMTDEVGGVPSPSVELPIDEFRRAAWSFLESIVPARRATSTVTVFGAGHDDLEIGRRYLSRLAEDGWSVPTWPAGLGGVGLGVELARAWAEELTGFELPDLYPFGIGLNMVGPTVLAHGTAQQRKRWLPQIATGAQIWCQLFSEPGAGSDLAGLATMARRRGHRWEITGQKVWSSRAQYADWGLLLARHEPGAVKHSGITCFGLPMDTEGIQVRPLRQMNGDAHFNEVFLDSVVVSDDNRIGEPGEGWKVARTTLSHERGAAGGAAAITAAQLIELARRCGRIDDPIVRQRLVKLFIDIEVARLTSQRWRAASGGSSGPEGSASKLRTVKVLKDAAELAGYLLGPEVIATPSEWQTLTLTAPSLSIRGGTDEIQRGILAERVLGLPKDPDPYRGLPWSDTPRS
jgi:alkylation response protein AidB-like acyl-CoA dehydrogenase